MTLDVIQRKREGYDEISWRSLRLGERKSVDFHEDEICTVLQRVVGDCDLPSGQVDEALDLMRTFYNGYNLQPEGGQIYNPTLALALALYLELLSQ